MFPYTISLALYEALIVNSLSFNLIELSTTVNATFPSSSDPSEIANVTELGESIENISEDVNFADEITSFTVIFVIFRFVPEFNSTLLKDADLIYDATYITTFIFKVSLKLITRVLKLIYFDKLKEIG